CLQPPPRSRIKRIRRGVMKPRVFIASSVEGKRLAEAIQANLDHDAYCTVWSQRPFVTGTIDSLLESVRTNDFGVFVLSPDDVTVLRGSNTASRATTCCLRRACSSAGTARTAHGQRAGDAWLSLHQ